MPAETLQIGPFVGGLNTQDDPSSIADEELVDCVNLDPQLNGSLQVRNPIQTITKIGLAGTTRILLLGTAVISGVEYVIGSNDGGVYQRSAGDWNLITSTFEAAAMVQYAGKVWLVPKQGSGSPGGTWDGTTFVADSDIPQGGAATIYKERMFVAPGFDATSNESRLKFSNAGNFGVWGASDFIDVVPGDGQKLVDLQVFKGNLLLFKERTTFNLAYDATPFDAVRDVINPLIGPSAPYCVVPYENSIFIYQEGRVYEMVNFDYQQVNKKVPFFFDGSAPSTRSQNALMAVIKDKLLVRHFNRIYVFSLLTRIWTRWNSDDIELHNFGRIIATTFQTNDEYFAGSSLLNSKNVFRIKADLDVATDERNIQTVTDTFTRVVADNWGTTDSGHTWTAETTAADFDVSGTEGTSVVNTVNATRRIRIANLQIANFDFSMSVKISAAATGASIEAGHMIRREDLDNGYRCFLRFNIDNTLDLVLVRRVGGSNTTLQTVLNILGGSYSSNTYYRIRCQIQGSVIKIKGWLAASAEPANFQISFDDTASMIQKPGTFAIHEILNTGNTNGTITFTWDNLVSNDLTPIITCSILTKNFNLAASHVYKRLNWWGVDILTPRLVTARVTPIVATAKVLWSFLKNNSFKWVQIKGNPWSFPTGGVLFYEDPDISTGSSVTRKFIKFVKALRYRQVNFRLDVEANGTLTEGPTRIYHLVMATSTRQLVSKKVS